MAVFLIETWDSRKGGIGAQGARITLKFVAIGTTNENELYLAILEQTPPIYDGLIRSDMDWTNRGGPIWDVEVPYTPTGAGGGGEPVGDTGTSGMGGTPHPEPTAPGNEDPLGAGYSFDTTGQTIHITQSLGVVTMAGKAGTTIPDVGNAIGATAHGVSGCDIFAPKMEWSRTVSRATCTVAYQKKLRDLTGTVNNDVFYERVPGSCLYLGASGQQTQGGLWSITHKFADAKNITTLEISDDIIIDPSPSNFGYAKLGWQYLDVHYKDVLEGDEVLSLPIAAFVHDVYELATFDNIGIGA